MTDNQAKVVAIEHMLSAFRYDVFWWSSTHKAWVIAGQGYKTIDDAYRYVHNRMPVMTFELRKVVIVDIILKKLVWKKGDGFCDRKLGRSLKKRVETDIGKRFGARHSTSLPEMAALMALEYQANVGYDP